MKWTWDKFGIHVNRPAGDPTQIERNPNIILDCMNLTNAQSARVCFYESIGRAIVMVDATDHNATLDDMRLASRVSGWDVDVYTVASLERMKQTAIRHFMSIDAINLELARLLIAHGYFTFDDLSIIEPDTLMQLGGFGMRTADIVIEQADIKGEKKDT